MEIRLHPGESKTPSSVDDLAVALKGSPILERLEVTSDDLHIARSDSDLLETLKIGHEILVALKGSDAFDAFVELPDADQTDFLRWIAATDDPDLRRQRTGTLASRLKESRFDDLKTSR